MKLTQSPQLGQIVARFDRTPEFLRSLFAPGERIEYRLVPAESPELKTGRKPTKDIRLFGARDARGGDGASASDWYCDRDRLTINQLEARQRRCLADNRQLFFLVAPKTSGEWSTAKASIRTVRTIFADLDDYGATAETLLAQCADKGIPRPMWIVRSGSGLHAYWRLAGDLHIPEPAEIKTGRELSETGHYFESILHGVQKELGCDATNDITRILRLPGSINLKSAELGYPGREPSLCEIVDHFPGGVYDIKQFEQFAVAKSRSSPQRRAAIASRSRRRRKATLGTHAPPAPPPQNDARLLEVMFSGTGGADRRALWEGDLSSRGGDWSTAVMVLINQLVRYGVTDPGRLSALIRQAPLMTLRQEGSRWDEAWLQNNFFTVLANPPRNFFDWRHVPRAACPCFSIQEVSSYYRETRTPPPNGVQSIREACQRAEKALMRFHEGAHAEYCDRSMGVLCRHKTDPAKVLIVSTGCGAKCCPHCRYQSDEFYSREAISRLREHVEVRGDRIFVYVFDPAAEKWDTVRKRIKRASKTDDVGYLRIKPYGDAGMQPIYIDREIPGAYEVTFGDAAESVVDAILRAPTDVSQCVRGGGPWEVAREPRENAKRYRKIAPVHAPRWAIERVLQQQGIETVNRDEQADGEAEKTYFLLRVGHDTADETLALLADAFKVPFAASRVVGL